ncbi:MAG TPA: alpha-glucan family phosphorylase [Gaiellaceae bacterium]|nr:alpha-glucan family phosphorylase [Gaiellaceae bacterium]
MIDSPAALRDALSAVAGNLSFSWLPGARALFADLDPERFGALHHNPTALLAEVSDKDLASALTPEYVERVEAVLAAVSAELDGPTWWTRRAEETGLCVAYFSCEFGLDESLPIYSGGLGVLSGDHLKSASELGVPLVGVGLLYREGYFRQQLDENGRQVERYPVNDFERLPVTREDVTVTVELALGEDEPVPVRAQVWRAQVGRTPLYLLDTDVEGNADWAREITDALYGGDREHRIHQEVVLGVGGVRALRELGVEPTVYHMNEGHSAFLQLERLRELVADQGMDRDAAVQRLRASTVFTTHTPVPAGNEVFDAGLVRRNVAALAARGGFEWDEFVALGRVDPDDESFGLTPFALRTASYANGVSELHGEVSREMWHELWPDRRVEDVPIRSITNGVHARTWISETLAGALGAEEETGTPDFARAYELDDATLWRIHRAAKEELLRYMAESRRAEHAFDPETLTIGFARRFATYKRADLLFSDPDRLAALLNDAGRPFQLVLAGKAHPADEGGKALIQRVVEFARDPRANGRIVFLEDYETTLARYLVQGVDVWLNTPRRPLEASGTSGMKAALNGGVNCSILDGWWVEGHTPDTGFAIGDDAVARSDAEQDALDRDSLFSVLERQVLPAFYERDENGIPQRWIELMRNSIAQLGARFNTNRMVVEYVEGLYLPAHREQLATA